MLIDPLIGKNSGLLCVFLSIEGKKSKEKGESLLTDKYV
jgi:hypothetical protein